MKRFKTKLHKLSNEALVMLAMRVLKTVDQSEVEAAKNAVFLSKIREQILNYMNTIGTNKNLDYSTKISTLFNKRKHLFDEQYLYLKGTSKSPDPELRQAAEKLVEVSSMLGVNFSQRKLADKSMRYKRLIEALKKPENESAITKLAMNDRLAELESVQLEYETLYMDRGNTKVLTIALSYVRVDIQQSLIRFYDELNWLILLNETEELISLRRIIEERMNELYSSRTAKTDEQLLLKTTTTDELSNIA